MEQKSLKKPRANGELLGAGGFLPASLEMPSGATSLTLAEHLWHPDWPASPPVPAGPWDTVTKGTSPTARGDPIAHPIPCPAVDGVRKSRAGARCSVTMEPPTHRREGLILPRSSLRGKLGLESGDLGLKFGGSWA